MAIFRYVMYVLKMWFKQVPKHPYVIVKWSLAATNFKLRAKILRLLEIDSVNLVIRTDEVIILSSLITLYRVSVQGVKSLGGHFACLCRGFEFYEVKKKNCYHFSKRKWKYFYTFNHFYSEKSSKRPK